VMGTLSEAKIGNLVRLLTAAAVVSAILYLHAYWFSLGVVIFDFLPFGALISYSIFPIALVL
ncbi:MAG TPA: hypothetical protein VEW69_08640, partial [Alphaproteobacteria bacterium]|nr:hypothetical protein [Alphaproteobacteria bacterium]